MKKTGLSSSGSKSSAMTQKTRRSIDGAAREVNIIYMSLPRPSQQHKLYRVLNKEII